MFDTELGRLSPDRLLERIGSLRFQLRNTVRRHAISNLPPNSILGHELIDHMRQK